MNTPGLLQTQIDCALVHLATAKDIAAKLDDGSVADRVAAQIQLGIDRLEDRWNT